MRELDTKAGQTPKAVGEADPHAVLDRLAAAFGADPIRDLVDRFSVMLTDALPALAGGGSDALAHRVGGLAGTLGFAAASRAWLALADGDADARTPAAVQSRQALAIIARWRETQ